MAKPRAKQFTVRDISETLGKLPPQAIDIEHAVIGELLSERGALQHVIDFLKPDHFYEETSKEIYSAILSLHRQHVPIDLITVKTYLEKTGKLEIVGGATTLVKLTALITSAANIVYHARIIVEMAIKREMILIASTIHHQGYDDSVDVFEFVEDSMAKIKDLYSRETTPSEEQRIKQQWESTLLTEKPPYRDPILSIGGTRVFTPGNHSLILGKQKSRKTLFLVWLIDQAVKQKRITQDQILYFDTEQSDEDVWEIREKIRKLTSSIPTIFMLRGCSHTERLNIIDNTLRYWKTTPRWIIIDGIRDLMSDINNADESNAIMTWLQKITYRRDLHITEVIHMNKADSNARGHIGTELLNRTEVTIEIELDKDPAFSNVKCGWSRRQAFDPFLLKHGPAPDYLPEVTGLKIGPDATDQQTQRNKLITMFDGHDLKYRELLDDMMDSFSISERKARHFIKLFQESGWLARIGKPRSPDAVYKLMISNNGHYQSNGTSPEQSPPPQEYFEPEIPF